MQRHEGYRKYHYRNRTCDNINRIFEKTAQASFSFPFEQLISYSLAEEHNPRHSGKGELKPNVFRRIRIEKQDQRQSR